MYYHFGLIGYPIQHSLSPFLHGQFFEQTALDGNYSIIEIDPSKNFSGSMESLKQMQLHGFNITVPYKQKIMEYLDVIDDSATNIGAVNTVVCKGNRWIGYNTDGIGYVRSLQNKFPELVNQPSIPILLLGAGGAAKGIYHGLRGQGYQNIMIANRTLEKAEEITKAKDKVLTIENAEKSLQQFDLIIQTTSVGMKPQVDESILSLEGIKKNTIVSDIVYQPIKTKFLMDAENNGAKVHFGHTMLVFQAQSAFQIWTNTQPIVDELIEQLQTKLEG